MRWRSRSTASSWRDLPGLHRDHCHGRLRLDLPLGRAVAGSWAWARRTGAAAPEGREGAHPPLRRARAAGEGLQPVSSDPIVYVLNRNGVELSPGFPSPPSRCSPTSVRGIFPRRRWGCTAFYAGFRSITEIEIDGHLVFAHAHGPEARAHRPRASSTRAWRTPSRTLLVAYVLSTTRAAAPWLADRAMQRFGELPPASLGRDIDDGLRIASLAEVFDRMPSASALWSTVSDAFT